MTDARTTRWRVAAPATLSLVSLGLLYASPLLLAGAFVPLGYAVYGALSAVPGDASVRVERSFDDRAPAPGAQITVAVTVTNTGEAVLPDVRVVDGVPPELAVVAGSPRRSLALRSGESATFRYAVVARRGEFSFADASVRLRSLAASGARTASLTVGGDERLTVRYPLSGTDAGGEAPRLAGPHPTDSAGPGAEFHSTREYRSGDPRSRLDWRRLAKTGELATVTFREERAVRTVLVVDAREPGRVAPRPGVPTGADLSGYAGERLFESLTDAGAVTSVVALGVDGTDTGAPVRPGGFAWADGTADARTALARSVFDAVGDVADTHSRTSESSDRGSAVSDDGGAGGERATVGSGEGEPGPATTDGTASSTGTDAESERVRLFVTQLPPAAEVVLVSPLLDDWPVSLVRALRSQGRPVTVVSPDVTGTGTVGGTVAGVERRRRLATLAAVGAGTTTWAPGDSLALSLAGVTDSVRGDA